MRFALLVRADEAAISPEERWRREAALASCRDRLRARAMLAFGEPLQFAEAVTTVRAWDGGDVEVTAGPAARPGEQVTGIYVIECGDLGEAVEVATQIPAAWYGSIEIRPVQAGPG
jgi:hypothetical protein